jgi:acyl-CoA dehydrogenase
MYLLNPKTQSFDHLDTPSKAIMEKTISYFETRGKQKLKSDYHERIWYEDFITFLKENEIFSTLLTPSKYAGGNPNGRWDTRRICDFNEILSFYNLSHWYTWQVSILGLGPIWMGTNETAKTKTAQLLKDGHIFAFGLSEKTHGADLYSSDMSLTPLGDGRYVADGGKYYIGNANKAGIVSTFGKNSETDDYVFFAVNPEHENYDLVQNVVDWEGYVAEYALNGYPITDDDILSTGREAWDCALNTINVGKFNLGWASIGICSHAFYEAIRHAANRRLFNHYVTDFPHIKQLFTDAYARLLAMKLFASRAADYMRSASATDRRYLLYNPMVKMKVTTQGEEVINLLWDVIAAKGFEKDMFFEMAARDIRALPKLEGTVHVNMALIIKFMANYFFNPDVFPMIPRRTDPVNDDFLFNQGPTKGLGKIRFHDYQAAYSRLNLPNIEIFKAQIEVLKTFLATATPSAEQAKDIDFLLIVGELFTLVAYGQLVLENAAIHSVENDMIDQIFDFMVRDFSKFALQLYSKPSSTQKQMDLCLQMIHKPVVNSDRFEKIWKDQVYALKEAYEMNT